jgi:hypothetical protein
MPSPSSAPVGAGPSVATMPWVQPYPDALLDEMASDAPGPEATAVSRETTSLAFLAAIQLLPRLLQRFRRCGPRSGGGSRRRRWR